MLSTPGEVILAEDLKVHPVSDSNAELPVGGWCWFRQ